jgi:hypothetical protein
MTNIPNQTAVKREPKTADVSLTKYATWLMARPKRFELLTPRFVVWCSIQLSYGRFSLG